MSQRPELNSIVEGKVVKIKPFGVIVQLQDSGQGLVHISHISSKYVQDINDFVSVGDTVNVKVLAVDGENGKISLSMKETEDNTPSKEQQPRDQQSLRPSDTQSSYSAPLTFEDKFKEWVKSSNERQAGINKRNKRR